MLIRAYLVSGEFRVHHADCRDCAREARRSDSSARPEEFPSQAAVIRSLWADIIAEDPGFYATPGGIASLEAETAGFSWGQLRQRCSSGCVSAAQRLILITLSCATGVVQSCYRRVA